MIVIETERLTLRWLQLDDADFILELLNQEAFIRFIGDKGVRHRADACNYLLKGPLASYRRHGFGLYLAELRQGGVPIGLCGLVKREALADVDLGFAFLPQYANQGYATEAAGAVLEHGREVLHLARIAAIVAPDNAASIAVIETIGLRFERLITLPGEGGEVRLYGPAGAPG